LIEPPAGGMDSPNRSTAAATISVIYSQNPAAETPANYDPEAFFWYRVRDGDPKFAHPPAMGDGFEAEIPAVESFVGLRTKALAGK
jgi:hypothetical protein